MSLVVSAPLAATPRLPLYERGVRAAWGRVMTRVEMHIAHVPELGTPRHLPEGSGERDVILVPGFGNTPVAMSAIGRSLERDGFRVHYLDIPDRAMGDAATGVRLLSDLVATVRAEHPAAQLDLVGHSRGGVLARDFALFGAGDHPIDRVVTVNSANHGIAPLGPLQHLFPQAMREILEGSKLIDSINAPAAPSISTRFTALSTEKSDLVLVPARSGRIDDGANVVIDHGRGRVTHYGVLTDDIAYDALRDALLVP